MQLCTLLLASLLNGSPFAQPPQAYPAAASQSPSACTGRNLEGQLNIHTASIEQWDLLPRIGPTTAERIVTYRERRGFPRVSHLMRVKGIGRKTFARIRPYLAVEGETTLQRPPKHADKPAACRGAEPEGAG